MYVVRRDAGVVWERTHPAPEKTAASALPLDHLPIALFNSDYNYLPRFCRFDCGHTLAHNFTSPIWIRPKSFDPQSSGHIQGGTQRCEGRQRYSRSHCSATRFFEGLRHAATSLPTFSFVLAWTFVLLCFGGGGITPRHHRSTCCEWIPCTLTGR